MAKYNFYAPKPLNLLGQNPRLSMLMDMGIPPGEDATYEEQKQKLLDQKDKLIDNSKLNLLDRIESAIQTRRETGKNFFSYGASPEGPLNPLEFVSETLAKTIPAPSELDIDRLSRSLPEIGQGIKEIASHPIAALKQAALNGPPDPTTVASMLVPGAALKAYRELVPLEARTYLHHMAGIPTPFTNVNERERAALIELAQHKIDKLLETQAHIDKVTAMNLRRVNDIKLMTPIELMEYAKNEGYTSSHLKELKQLPINKLRETLISDYKRARPSTFKAIKRDLLNLGEEADNENVRSDFTGITGRQLHGFQIYPSDYVNGNNIDFLTALGKTYVEPMIDKTTGQIVPKSIKDTYRFYPGVYAYPKGIGLDNIKDLFNSYLAPYFEGRGNIKTLGISVREFMKNLFSMEAHEPAGILARKIGMHRPTSIIDIPLQTPAPMNAYDKAAILLGAKAAAQKKE